MNDRINEAQKEGVEIIITDAEPTSNHLALLDIWKDEHLSEMLEGKINYIGISHEARCAIVWTPQPLCTCAPTFQLLFREAEVTAVLATKTMDQVAYFERCRTLANKMVARGDGLVVVNVHIIPQANTRN
jgi:hypothetical protein